MTTCETLASQPVQVAMPVRLSTAAQLAASTDHSLRSWRLTGQVVIQTCFSLKNGARGKATDDFLVGVSDTKENTR